LFVEMVHVTVELIIVFPIVFLQNSLVVC
jgi:hypothetical protein